MGPPGAEHGRVDCNGAAVGRYATPVYVLPCILKFGRAVQLYGERHPRFFRVEPDSH